MLKEGFNHSKLKSYIHKGEMTMNEQSLTVKEAIKQRRSIKKFNGQPVDREDLLTIIDDATWAPNHGNREPCIR